MKIPALLITANLFMITAQAQNKAVSQFDEPSLLHASIGVQGVVTTPDHVPFWMRSNQFGSIPLPGTTGSAIGSIRIDYDSTSGSLMDWGGGAEARADFGSGSRITLIEGYLKFRIWAFELKAGRSKEIMGLVDSSLSSGAFAVSGNALGIPKIQVSFPDYVQIPWFGHLFAVKGNFAHGWIGDVPVQYGHLTNHATAYFHQKSLYVRLGRPEWNWRLFGGFNHQVFWGDERAVFGSKYNLSVMNTYFHVVTGKTWNYSKVGNHLGSIDMGAEIDWDKVRLSVYRLNFYDEGALYHLANIKDGLNGISLTNRKVATEGFQWKKILFEFLYSVNQAGEPSSVFTKSGDENYYNNYEYAQGWSYKGLGLGSPFLSTRTSTRQDLPNDTTDFFNNNRVAAFHLGAQASAGSWSFTGKFSYSINYGTYGTSPFGHTTGRLRVPPRFGLFPKVNQFSSWLEVTKSIGDYWDVGCVAALDAGKLLYNSSGVILKLSRKF